MGKRREAREMAVQFLYQWEVGHKDLEEALSLYWSHFDNPPDEETRQFTETLVRGVVAHQPEMDEKIRQFAEHWDLGRIAAVDRNILRLAIYEMLYRDD